MANSANEAVTPQSKFSFYTTSKGTILVFPAIEDFALIPGAQEILEEVGIEGGNPQGLLPYDVLMTAVALKTAKGENFPENVEAKLTTLSDALVSTDALVAVWESLQESHITDQATELADVPAERADLIAQIISNNPKDFVSTEVEAGEMTVTFVAGTDATTEVEPEETTEVVETTEVAGAEPTTEQEAQAETEDPETGIVAETVPQTDALAHFENAENAITVTEGNVAELIGMFATTAQTQNITAKTQDKIAATQESLGKTLEAAFANLPKTAQTVTVDAEVVTTPAEA